MKMLVVVVVMVLAVGARGQTKTRVPFGDDRKANDAWTAKWIGDEAGTVRAGATADGSEPLPLFRREFVVRGKVAKAELRIAGLGQWQASLDGGPAIGGEGLHQSWTDYRKTVTYETYDLTAAMTVGRHVLGVELGNGMYNVQKTVYPKAEPGVVERPAQFSGKARYTKFEGSYGAPKLLAELRLRYADGQTEVIGTDDKWKSGPGGTVFSSTYGGEDFDARLEPEGWRKTGFDDAKWAPVKVVEGPGGALVRAMAPEVRALESHAVVKTTQVGAVSVYDLGQNFAGVVRVKVRGPRGAVLRLTPGELLNGDGTVSQKSSGGPMWWTYTLAGDDDGETWEPRFGYYGFRYVQAEWVYGGAGPDTAKKFKAVLAGMEGRAFRSDAKVVGTFESSNTQLNRIHKLILEAMHNNEMSLFTDCPHREKLGWLEETHLVAVGMMFNSDLQGLFRATEQNIADAQGADGMVPTIAPQYTKFGPKYAIYDDSPEWGSAAVLAPWAAYRFYGEKGELERSYAVMQRYMAYLQGWAKDGIVAYGLGDWYDIGPGGPGFEKNTTLGVTGTLMLYEDAVAMGRIARVLGRGEDAAGYEGLAGRTAEAFNARFWDAAKGWYDTGSQTANAMPLALGVVPEARRAGVLAHVIADIHAHQDHVTTGEVGYPYLLRALMAAGRDDVVMAMMMRDDAPSYGSQLKAGATALTEAWDANPANSQDHFMLGGGEEWFYRGLGGIDVDMSREKAEERITIRPAVNEAVEGLGWVKTSYESALGMIGTEWRAKSGIVTVTVTIPPATNATVILPRAVETDGKGKVLGKGRTDAVGVTTFLVRPGRHTFEATVLQL